MRYLTTVILAGFLFLSSFSQNTVKGIVRDMYTFQPLAGVHIVAGNTALVAAEDGSFQVLVKANQLFSFQKNAYCARSIELNASTDYITILLQPSNYAINEQSVTGFTLKGAALSKAGAIEVFSPAEDQRTNPVRLDHAFNLLPGIRMERRTEGGGIRMVMRGYGNQSNSIGSGFKLYYNGIPITDADGTTLLDDVDLGTIGRVEILKGPASSIYGSGIAGTIQMFAEKAVQGISVAESVEAGSYGLLRTNTQFSLGSRQSNIVINYGRQQMDGFRLNAASAKNFLTFTGDFYATEKRNISVFFSYAKILDDLAGQLNRRQFIATPDTAELALLQNAANVEIESFRTGITQDYRFGQHLSNRTTLFLTAQTIDQPSYTTISKTNKSKFGARTSFDWELPIGKELASISWGAEVNKNISYQKSYGYTAGVFGSLRSDLELKPLMYHFFSQVGLTLQEGTTLTLGGSMNYLEYNQVDERAALFGYVNTSGYKKFTPLFTPSFSLQHYLNKSKTLSFYTSYHIGFSPPATSQVIITQTGLVNKAVNPEIAESIEIGSKGSLFNSHLQYRVAFFNMDVKDKLVTQSFAAANGIPAYTITTNAGTVNGKGIEAMMDYSFRNPKAMVSLLRPFVSYTYHQFTNVDFKSDNNNTSATKIYNGLAVSGIAKNILNFGIDLESRQGFYINCVEMITGRMPIVYDNSEWADAYYLINMRLGWHGKFPMGHHKSYWAIDPFTGIENMTGQRYSTFINLNQSYIGTTPNIAGTSQALFFNPAPPKANWYAGCSLRFIF